MQERFHHYYLTEQLASKPLRSAYLAHRVNDTSEKVVLKLFDAACLNLDQESENLLQKVEWAKRFKHSNIVPVLDVGVEQGQPYVVSKYLSSGSLRHHLDCLSPQHLDLQEALAIIRQVGQALCYAHQHNILHGNVKPENIFFNGPERVLLADFRLASFINVAKLNYKSDPHTTCYLAPEQFSGSISEKSDQYALACLAYELIAGSPPFSAQGFFSMWAKQNTQCVVPLSDLVPDLPEPIEQAVLKALAKDPSERYTHISQFLRAIETVSLPQISVPTRPMIARPSTTLVTKEMKPSGPLESNTPFVTYLSNSSLATRVLTHPEQVNHEHNASMALSMNTPPSQTLSMNTPPSEAHIKPLLEGRLPQSGKPMTPTLWLAFALSSIVILMGTVILYALAPLHSPESTNPVKSSPVVPTATNPVIHITAISQPTAQIHATAQIETRHSSIGGRTPFPLTPMAQSVQASLTGNYANQINQTYNLTTEGTLDWIDWGLNAPGDVNRKSGVPLQISNCTIIGNGPIQRDSYYSNSYIAWSDGTPLMAAQPQQASGVYVTGINNGFTITVLASTTRRTLKVYIGATHAQGKFTASLDGKTYSDGTLDTTQDSNSAQDNGVYTVVFNGNAPNQVLTVTYTAMATNGNNSHVLLQAATLQ